MSSAASAAIFADLLEQYNVDPFPEQNVETEPEPEDDPEGKPDEVYPECWQCKFRNRVFHTQDSDAESEYDERHPTYENIRDRYGDDACQRQLAAHEFASMPDVWLQIMLTDTLCQGKPALNFDDADGKLWFRFPVARMRRLRDDPAHTEHVQHTSDVLHTWDFRPVHRTANDTFVCYHAVSLHNLVNGHPKAPGSTGILKDGGMHYGIQHGDGIGVYMYSYFPAFMHDCVVELEVLPYLTTLEGGSKGRYVMKSNQDESSIGAPCNTVLVRAFYTRYDVTPNWLKVPPVGRQVFDSGIVPLFSAHSSVQ